MDIKVKEVKVKKDISRIYIGNIDLGELEKSQIRYIIQQLDNIIE